MIQRVQGVRVDEDRKVWVDLLAAALAVVGSAGAATMSVSNLFNPIVAKDVLALAVALVAVGVDGDLDGLKSRLSTRSVTPNPKTLTEAYMLSELVIR